MISFWLLGPTSHLTSHVTFRWAPSTRVWGIVGRMIYLILTQLLSVISDLALHVGTTTSKKSASNYFNERFLDRAIGILAWVSNLAGWRETYSSICLRSWLKISSRDIFPTAMNFAKWGPIYTISAWGSRTLNCCLKLASRTPRRSVT